MSRPRGATTTPTDPFTSAGCAARAPPATALLARAAAPRISLGAPRGTAARSIRSTTSGSSTASSEIRIERVFNAPRDRVWRAFTDPALVKQWWGRGNKLVIERMEVEPGGHWRYVEHGPDGVHGFEGRYREVTPQERLVHTFEWDGMPGYVAVETVIFEDLGDGRTKLVNLSLFHTTEERDGMLQSGMEEGLNQSYAALDRLLGTLD